MGKSVVIFGGTGFVGREIAKEAMAAGWSVRLAARSAKKAAVAGAEMVACNILKDDDVTRALEGMDAAINCVGILAARGENSFQALQEEGAARIARLAAAQGIKHFVQLSAIGANTGSASEYQRTKGKGEEAVRAAMPGAVILRPSIVFGPGDSFFNRFADMSKLSPFVPVVGGGTRFQPVFVGDVAKAALAGIEGAEAGVYELGGPNTETFAALMERMLGVLNRKRLVLSLPAPIGMVMGLGFETLSKLTGGLVEPQITRDQVKNLGSDNVASDALPGLADLGVTPTAMDHVLPTYLK